MTTSDTEAPDGRSPRLGSHYRAKQDKTMREGEYDGGGDEKQWLRVGGSKLSKQSMMMLRYMLVETDRPTSLIGSVSMADATRARAPWLLT